MKAKYDIEVTYLDENGQVKVDKHTKSAFEYTGNGMHFAIVNEDEKTDDDKGFTNKITWYPKERILKVTALMTSTFETKEERKNYYAAKAGLKVKGNAIKN